VIERVKRFKPFDRNPAETRARRQGVLPAGVFRLRVAARQLIAAF
jgi:hypothetical protein